MDATLAVGTEHDEDDAVLGALGVVVLAVTDLVAEAIVEYVVEVEGELVLPTILPIIDNEVAQVENGEEELLEMVFHRA